MFWTFSIVDAEAFNSLARLKLMSTIKSTPKEQCVACLNKDGFNETDSFESIWYRK